MNSQSRKTDPLTMADVMGFPSLLQEQVEQNLAVRCMQSVGTMLATMRIDQGEQVRSQTSLINLI